MKKRSNCGSLSGRLLQAQDVERRRISRELHDSVGQALVTARMALNRAMRANHNTRTEDLQECLQLIDGALREVRSVSYLLHPPILDLVGLGAAIRNYVKGVDKRSQITLHIEIPDNLQRMSPEKETAAFRIVQECLTNVHRYSGASNAWVRINSARNQLRVEVEDDGKGIATSDLTPTKANEVSVGVGIQGMRERIRELGGLFEIGTSGPGTRVTATIPDVEDHPEECASFPISEPKWARNADVPIVKDNGSSKRILIVEDHEIMRRGIRVLIENEPDLEICGEAATAAEAIESIKELKPDVVILDLMLPDANGWRVVRTVRTFDFWTKILVFTAHTFTGLANTTRAARCEGLLTKSRGSTDLITALRTVLGGQTFYLGDRAASQSA